MIPDTYNHNFHQNDIYYKSVTGKGIYDTLENYKRFSGAVGFISSSLVSFHYAGPVLSNMFSESPDALRLGLSGLVAIAGGVAGKSACKKIGVSLGKRKVRSVLESLDE